MAGNIIVDASDLKGLISKMKYLSGKGTDEIMNLFLNTAGNEFLAKVVKRTPYRTNTLRENWNWRNTKKKKAGKNYELKIFNPIEYAEYVEYGHRQEVGRYVPALKKRLKQPWIPGQFFMKSSAEEMKHQLPAMLKKKLEIKVRRALDV